MEHLDIVNEQDEVVGKAAYGDIYSKKLPHRIVHIFIFNSKGEMALQLRSKTKSFCPNHWSTAVGGHVRSGESYKEAALREFQEELGATAELEPAHKDCYDDPRGFFKFLVTFKVAYEGPFEIEPEEVESVQYFSLNEIHEMIEAGEKFHPELLFLLKKHYF